MARTKGTSKRKAARKATVPDLYRETVNIHPEAENPTPWPVRVEDRLAQAFTRIAALEAKWSDLIHTIKEEVQAEWARQKAGK